MNIRLLVLFSALIFLGFIPTTHAAEPLTIPLKKQINSGLETQHIFDNIVQEVCKKDVILLGENGFHGDGATINLKTNLAIDIIEKCDVDLILFEAPIYDFLELSKLSKNNIDITDGLVSSSLGIYSRDKEIQPFIKFLAKGLNAHRFMVGGLDDQLSIRGAHYSLEKMPKDIMGFIASKNEKQACTNILLDRTLYRYSDQKEYTPTEADRIVDCLKLARKSLSKNNLSSHLRENSLAMIDAIERALKRDFIDFEHYPAMRDKSMFQAFEWLQAQLNPRKTLIWSLNAHLSKTAEGLAEFPDGNNLGSYIFEKLGNTIYSLGFTATKGSFRIGTKKIETIETPPPEALENLPFTSDFYFMDANSLNRMAVKDGALFGHKYTHKNWPQYFDGILILKEEKPTERLQ